MVLSEVEAQAQDGDSSTLSFDKLKTVSEAEPLTVPEQSRREQSRTMNSHLYEYYTNHRR
jgi:hypothetical protein